MRTDVLAMGGSDWCCGDGVVGGRKWWGCVNGVVDGKREGCKLQKESFVTGACGSPDSFPELVVGLNRRLMMGRW